MAQKTMLIVNPVSGRGKVKNYLLSILKELSVGGEPVTVFVTEKHGDATRFSAEYGAQYDRLVCNGGDGTLNEVINGLMHVPQDERPSICYIPLGTTNDMASSFELPKTTEEVLAHLNDNTTRTVDVGQFGDSFFGYVAAFGAFTDIPYTTPQNDKNTWGYLAYLVQALGSIQNIVPIHAVVEYDGGTIDDEFVLGAIVNSTSVAGIIKLPSQDVSLDDGIFEVLLIKMPRTAAELNMVITNVLLQDFNNEYITLLHTKNIRFTFDSAVTWTIDGEDGGSHQEVSAQNCHRAISLII